MRSSETENLSSGCSRREITPQTPCPIMTIDCQVVHVCGIHEKQEHPSFRRILSILSLGQTLSCIPRQAIEFFFGELHRSLQGSEAVVRQWFVQFESKDFITYSICLWDWSPQADFPQLSCSLSILSCAAVE